MKALVLYDSKFGNTQKIAETVAEEIAAKVMSVTDFTRDSLAEVDVFVVGSPINGWRPTGATSSILAHLEGHSLQGTYVAAFDTGYKSGLSGNAAARILKDLRKAGGTPLVPTHKFIVEQSEGPLAPGEIERAQEWAQEIKTAYARVAPVSALGV